MFQNLLIIFNKKQKLNLVFLLILNFTFLLLEVLALSTIPLFVALVSYQKNIFKFIPFEIIEKTFSSFNLSSLYLIFSSLILIAFVIKNLFLTFLIYFEKNLIRNLEISLSKRIYKIYLNENFSFHVNNNPSYLLNTISKEIKLSIMASIDLLNLSKEIVIVN